MLYKQRPLLLQKIRHGLLSLDRLTSTLSIANGFLLGTMMLMGLQPDSKPDWQLEAFLAISTYLNLEVHHVDIETTFLHGDLEETIYMEQPKMMENEKYPDYVCMLHKPLYGLKQSPRQWYAKLHKFLLNANFTRLYSEPNLYVRKTRSEFIILEVYVDDLPIAGTSEKEILEVIKELQHHFPVKHLGPLEHFLGIHV